MTRARRTAALALAAVAAGAAVLLPAACKTSRKNVLVRVEGVPPGTRALEAGFTLDGVPALNVEELEAPSGGFSATTTFVVLLPDDATGELGVTVTALDEGRCRFAQGTGLVTLPADTVTVALTPFGPDCSTIDASLPDAGVCDDCDVPPVLRSPVNGATTGSVHATSGSPPLRPELRWDPVANAGSFRVQMDDSCTLPFAGCPFPSPEIDEVVGGNTIRFRPPSNLPVATAPPVGTRYFWRVQVCDRDDVCSYWSPVRYLDAGRQAGDFNGDGYADSIMSSYGQDPVPTSPDVGTGWVLYGAGTLATAPQQELGSPSPQTSAIYGSWVAAVGDVNADGFGDAVFAASLQDLTAMDEGVLYLFLGSNTGLVTPPAQQITSTRHVVGGQFGARMAGAGDVNGDGYADFAAAAIFAEDMAGEEDEGDVYVYQGGPTIPLTAPTWINNPIAAQPGARFGTSLGMNGDLDGDGYADLVVGATAASLGATGEGAIFVFAGSPDGVLAVPQVLDCPANEPGAQFGTAAELGDVNGDGFDDLLTGAEGHDGDAIDEGIGFVYYGGRGGVPATPSLGIDAPGHPPGAHFADEITLGDVNGDGFVDAVASSPGFSGAASQVGEAYLYLGGSGGLDPNPALVLPAPYVQTDAQFGTRLATPGDMDGDGFADVAEGSLFVDFAGVDSGMTHIFLGSPLGLDATPSREYGSPSPQVGGYFGFGLAWRMR